MDIEKLIEDLRVACAGNQHNIMGVAATALSALQAENEELRADVVRFNDLLASYQNVLVPELRVENNKLRAEVEHWRNAHRQAALNFQQENRECNKVLAELEQVKAERDAALEHLHGICSACKNYSPYHNTGKCRFCVYEPAREKDVEANDNWQWSGPKKED